MRKIISWWLDYIYVAYWQLRSVLPGYNEEKWQRPSQQVKLPILVIPGVYENWRFMQPLIKVLHESGHSVYVIKQLGYNYGQIEDAAGIVREFVEQNDLKDFFIVAHSKGGLVAKYVMLDLAISKKIRRIIAINTPFSGSRYARLFWIRSIRSFSTNDPVLSGLAKNRRINSKIVSIYASFDPHIPERSYLDGAEVNIELEFVGHFRILGNKSLQHQVLKYCSTE